METAFIKKTIKLKGYNLTHVGGYTVGYVDAYLLVIPLGKDYSANLIVDADAVKNSGFFDVHQPSKPEEKSRLTAHMI